MAGIGGTAGELALWLHLRQGQISPLPSPLPVPAGDAPLVLIHVPAGEADPAALAAIADGLRATRQAPRLVIAGGLRSDAATNGPTLELPPLTSSPDAITALSALRPTVVLILGDDIPPALVSAAFQARVPVLLAEARLSNLRRGFWKDTIARATLSRIGRILAPDRFAAEIARRFGANPVQLEMIGPVTDTRAPLRGNEAERQVMAKVLSGRHIWLAASPSVPEIEAVLTAHRDALHYNHRALLILAGLPDGALDQVLAMIDALEMTVVQRDDDEDPQPDDQILIAESDDELGLWYRLAPVCFIGGTLIEGEALPARHPFEPASLGSAIIHGPLTGPYEAEWSQLDAAHAARRVGDADELRRVVGDMSSAEQAAILAQNAWNVSTGGAAVVRRIVSEVLSTMETKA